MKKYFFVGASLFFVLLLSACDKAADWQKISEWNLKYKLNLEHKIVYNFQSVTAQNSTAVSRLSFKVDNDEKWGHCPLPTIAEFKTDPAKNNVLGVSADKVKKLRGKYYAIEDSLSEPCFSLTGGEVISGEDETAWMARRDLVQEIFTSLKK